MSKSNFNHLIPKLTDSMSKNFILSISSCKEFHGAVDTGALLNLILSVYVSSLEKILQKVKDESIAEKRLVDNIDLAMNSILKAVLDLPFITVMERI